MVAGTSGGGFGAIRPRSLQLKPVGIRKVDRRRSDRPPAPQDGGNARRQMFLQSTRTCASAAARPTPSINTPCRRRIRHPARVGTEGAGRACEVPEIADVSSDQQDSGLSSNVVIDRDTASRLGLTAQAVDSALYDAFGQRQVSVMYKSINQYHVVLALEQQWWENPDFLNTIYVQTPKGITVPLSTFTHFTQGITPISLPHQGQFPATTISFNLRGGRRAQRRRAAINRAELDMGVPPA